MSNLDQGFPKLQAPLVDITTGNVNQPWLQLFINLWKRTGSATNSTVTGLNIVNANGVSGTTSGSPVVDITLMLGDITPTSINSSGIIIGSNLSGTNTGDVSLSGQPYLSLINQIITAHPIDLSSEVIGSLPATSIAAGTANINISGNAATATFATSAGNVTTNANLTGPITSVGNATSIASQTGTGTKFVVDTSPMLITPNIGVATATSITFSPTTDGIIGTPTNDNAASGYVGEYISSQIASGSAISLSNNTTANITSISLSAGDWNVWGNVTVVVGGSTVTTNILAGISLVSAVFPTPPNNGGCGSWQGSSTGTAPIVTAGTMRLSLSSTTTVYLVVFSTFTVSTSSAYGFIGARRIR
jgi:hypothetical protein